MTSGRAPSIRERFGALAEPNCRRFLAVVFGDRVGVTVFLAALCVYVLYWRVGIFITDTYAVANSFVALSEGHLAVERAAYGPGVNTPGMHVVDGAYYGRNYGQLVTALPFLWGLRAVTGAVGLAVAAAGLWSALLFGLATQLGVVFDRRGAGLKVGAAVAVGGFLINVPLAEPVEPALVPLAALELHAMVASALTAVVLYRLVALSHGRTVAAFAGAVTALATPLGFWAVFPKRHAPMALLLVSLVYAFHRSRSADRSPGSALGPRGFRAMAYAMVGLAAWIHAAEALLVLFVLVVVDVCTAPQNDLRTLAVVGASLGLSLVPFAVTNALIAGEFLTPPRMLEPVTEAAIERVGETTGRRPAETAGSDGSLGPSVLPPSIGQGFLGPVGRLFETVASGLAVAVTDPERVVHTVLKSGDAPRVGSEHAQAVNLTLLESTPILGALAGSLLAGIGRLWPPRRSSGGWLVDGVASRVHVVRTDARRATDLLVAVLAVSFVIFYQQSLPLFAQITVRYLVPVVPLLVYALARLRTVRTLLEEHDRTVYWSWLLGTLFGVQLVADLVVVFDLSMADAMQLHAWLSLGVATGITAAFALRSRFEIDRYAAVCLGLGAATGTVLLLLAGLDYFDYAGEYAVPLVRFVTDSIRLA